MSYAPKVGLSMALIVIIFLLIDMSDLTVASKLFLAGIGWLGIIIFAVVDDYDEDDLDE